MVLDVLKTKSVIIKEKLLNGIGLTERKVWYKEILTMLFPFATP